MARGGSRVGAGRKPWKETARLVSSGEMPEPVAGPTVAPPRLRPAVQAVWDELAPKATQRGTLVPETAYAFAVLCRLCVEVDAAHAQAAKEGPGTREGRELGRLYLGLTQRQETQLRAFRLGPEGKAIAPVEKPKAKTAFERLKDGRPGLHAV